MKQTLSKLKTRFTLTEQAKIIFKSNFGKCTWQLK